MMKTNASADKPENPPVVRKSGKLVRLRAPPFLRIFLVTDALLQARRYPSRFPLLRHSGVEIGKRDYEGTN